MSKGNVITVQSVWCGFYLWLTISYLVFSRQVSLKLRALKQVISFTVIVICVTDSTHFPPIAIHFVSECDFAKKSRSYPTMAIEWLSMRFTEWITPPFRLRNSDCTTVRSYMFSADVCQYQLYCWTEQFCYSIVLLQ